MANMPKRRKYRDNPYTLEIKNEKYFVKFKDVNKREQFIEIDTQIYNVFNESELHDLSEMNEYDNHIEHSEIYDNSLYKKSIITQKSIEEQIYENEMSEELICAINKLSAIQKRRIIMYYFNDMSLQEIAVLEKTTHQAISKNIKNTLMKLKKLLKHLNN